MVNQGIQTCSSNNVAWDSFSCSCRVNVVCNRDCLSTSKLIPAVESISWTACTSSAAETRPYWRSLFACQPYKQPFLANWMTFLKKKKNPARWIKKQGMFKRRAQKLRKIFLHMHFQTKCQYSFSSFSGSLVLWFSELVILQFLEKKYFLRKHF